MAILVVIRETIKVCCIKLAIMVNISVIFFPRENKISLRENFQISARENLKCPWKNLEKCPWKAKSLRENFFEFTRVKKKYVYVKKSSSYPRQNWNKTPLLHPWKQKSYPWKNLEKCPWKTSTVREKVCVKKKSRPWKNLKKGQKWLSRALLIFTGKKENTDGHNVDVLIEQ